MAAAVLGVVERQLTERVQAIGLVGLSQTPV
jgi:hypothetical protein